MEVKTLQHHIAALAALEETDAPVLTCYLTLEKGALAYPDVLAERIPTLKESLHPSKRFQVDAAFSTIEGYLQERRGAGSLGLALFSRAGKQPFFLPLEFRVPLPSRMSVSLKPDIYHLAEIKDNYDRYVVLLCAEESAGILEINLGSITHEVWRARPELLRRFGKEWTKEHYQNHRRERNQQFIREQIRVADRLMSTGGYRHLILAGATRVTASIMQALPKHLLARLVDVVSTRVADKLSDVVAATLQPFLEHEEKESQAVVERLLQHIHTTGWR